MLVGIIKLVGEVSLKRLKTVRLVFEGCKSVILFLLSFCRFMVFIGFVHIMPEVCEFGLLVGFGFTWNWLSNA